MFFISFDIDLSNNLQDDKKEQDLFSKDLSEEEKLMYQSLLLSELVPIFLLLAYSLYNLAKYLFKYQQKLQQELVDRIKNNPQLMHKIDKFLNKISKKWNKLNKKLNQVLVKGFTIIYNLALFLLGIEFIVIYFNIVFYFFYNLFKGIKQEFLNLFKYCSNSCYLNSCYPNSCYPNGCCPCFPCNINKCDYNPCYQNIMSDDYYMYNEFDDYYDDYYDCNPYT